MSPFAFDPTRRAVPSFAPESHGQLTRFASNFPERESVEAVYLVTARNLFLAREEKRSTPSTSPWWPSLELELATITLVDQVRIAGLISTIGM